MLVKRILVHNCSTRLGFRLLLYIRPKRKQSWLLKRLKKLQRRLRVLRKGKRRKRRQKNELYNAR